MFVYNVYLKCTKINNVYLHAGVCLCGGNIPNSDQKCWSRLRLRLGSGRRDYCSLHRSNLLFVFICLFVCCHIFYSISKCSVFCSGRELGKTSPDAPLYIFGATSLIGGHFPLPWLFLSRIVNYEKDVLFWPRIVLIQPTLEDLISKHDSRRSQKWYEFISQNWNGS